MLNKLKREVVLNLKNIPGWRTRRKIVILESDDWGSLRIASQAAADRLQSEGVIDAEKTSYNILDSLESKEDMEQLFDVLSSVKDKNGRHAVLTPFVNMANPDFSKIAADNYQNYYYEPFPDTLKRFGQENVMPLYEQGINSAVFLPEYHGREHVNVAGWMKALQKGEPKVLKGFKNDFMAVNLKSSNPYLKSFRQTFYFDNADEIPALKTSITEGAELFEKIFNYKATVFDPPNGIFHRSLEEVLYKAGIKNIVLQRFRYEPDGKGGAESKYYNFGQKNEFGQIYHIRNCMFEPYMGAGVPFCMGMVKAAFRWGKPAVICTHRVNFVGGMDPANRTKGLDSLSILLKTILKRWPDVEFMSSGEFARLMHSS